MNKSKLLKYTLHNYFIMDWKWKDSISRKVPDCGDDNHVFSKFAKYFLCRSRTLWLLSEEEQFVPWIILLQTFIFSSFFHSLAAGSAKTSKLKRKISNCHEAGRKEFESCLKGSASLVASLFILQTNVWSVLNNKS